MTCRRESPGIKALLLDSESKSALPDPEKTALIIVTEGETDPAAYEDIVGRHHDSVGRVLTAVS